MPITQCLVYDFGGYRVRKWAVSCALEECRYNLAEVMEDEVVAPSRRINDVFEWTQRNPRREQPLADIRPVLSLVSKISFNLYQ